jgi:hypothetical protein
MQKGVQCHAALSAVKRLPLPHGDPASIGSAHPVGQAYETEREAECCIRAGRRGTLGRSFGSTAHNQETRE